VTLPEQALAACARETRRIEQALGPLAKALRFPHGEGLHFTLKFLGEAGEEQVAPIIDRLTYAVNGATQFTVALKGLEAFPSARKPRVVFLGASEGGAPMIRLAQAFEEAITPLGFPANEHPFTPHVTLARVKDVEASREIGERLETLEAIEVARFEVGEVALMQSTLDSTGSRYSALRRLPLGR
jgi:2'-5' RNA ligase